MLVVYLLFVSFHRTWFEECVCGSVTEEPHQRKGFNARRCSPSNQCRLPLLPHPRLRLEPLVRCDWRCGLLCFGSCCGSCCEDRCCCKFLDVIEFTPQTARAQEEEGAAEEGWRQGRAQVDDGGPGQMLVDLQWSADGKKKTAQCGVCRQLALDCPSTARKP